MARQNLENNALLSVQRGKINDNFTELYNQTYSTVAASSNVYTLDLSTVSNFAIETEDTVAKEIVFSNTPNTANRILQITVKLKHTNAAAFTHPTGTSWKDAITPTFTATKTYFLLYTSYDAGTTWLSTSIGAW